jgi:hypothetical protein
MAFGDAHVAAETSCVAADDEERVRDALFTPFDDVGLVRPWPGAPGGARRLKDRLVLEMLDSASPRVAVA